MIHLAGFEGRIGEDLKRIAYSLTFLQGREEPVNVPPDVRAFFDMVCVDLLGSDVKAIMAHYSYRYLNSGGGKAYVVPFSWNDPMSPAHRGATSCEATVTVFEPHGDKAYMDGFFLTNAKGDTSALKAPIKCQQIINEHGEWRWFGNQK